MCPAAGSFQISFGKWVWVAIFAIAFAWVESAVVVYLREIFFDGEFGFPLIIEWQEGQRIYLETMEEILPRLEETYIMDDKNGGLLPLLQGVLAGFAVHEQGALR